MAEIDILLCIFHRRDRTIHHLNEEWTLSSLRITSSSYTSKCWRNKIHKTSFYSMHYLPQLSSAISHMKIFICTFSHIVSLFYRWHYYFKHYLHFDMMSFCQCISWEVELHVWFHHQSEEYLSWIWVHRSWRSSASLVLRWLHLSQKQRVIKCECLILYNSSPRIVLKADQVQELFDSVSLSVTKSSEQLKFEGAIQVLILFLL